MDHTTFNPNTKQSRSIHLSNWMGSILVHLLVVAVILKTGYLPLKKSEIVWLSLNNAYLPLVETASAPLAKIIKTKPMSTPEKAVATTTPPVNNTEEQQIIEQKPTPTEPKSVPKIQVRQTKVLKPKAPSSIKVKNSPNISQIISKPPDAQPVSSQIDNSVGLTTNLPPLNPLSQELSRQVTAHQTTTNAQNSYLHANFDGIRNKVSDNLRYPPMAQRQGWSGKVQVKFTILLSGAIENIQILSSSGYPLLDRQALQAITIAAPFPVPPVVATITIPVTFELN